MENVVVEKEAPTVINVFPINKGKRVLAYLADFFLCFLISFLLFNIAVYPISYVAINYASIQEKADEANKNINSVLSYADLVYFEDSNKSNLNEGLSYTFDLYMADIVSEAGPSHDVFYTYYVTKLNNKDRYYSLYEQFDKKFGYFSVDKNNEKITLSKVYQEAFEPLKVNKDALSIDAIGYYDTMFNKFFLTYYSQMLKDIETSDIEIYGISYNENHNVILEANKVMDNMIIVDSVIAFVIGWLICFILVPMINQYHKTIGMLMMKLHRIDIRTMKILNKKQIGLSSIYSLFTNMVGICFLPLMVINIDYIFNLTITLWFSVASLLIVVVSLIALLISKSNQSLCDSVTGSAYISNDSLDEIYRARGYYI